MEQIDFDMSTFHEHGSAFYQYLGLRKRFFVETLGWDVPHDARVEMDQYDNPLARYSLVLRDGAVIGGARAMPTTAVWGAHTYMLRDAVEGKLGGIPADVMDCAVSSAQVWECTRLVVSDDLRSQAERGLCLSLIVEGLVGVAARHGATRLMSLSPLSLMRALRQLGFAAERLGAPYRSAGDGRQYAVLAMPAMSARRPAARATHMPRRQALHAPALA